LRQIQTEAGETIFTDASRIANTPVVIPAPQAFTVERVGKIYYVYFAGIQVCAGPYRRRAHGMARAGNNFLRRIQIQQLVSPDTIVDLFREYFTIASDPAGGFQPVMSVVS
jgi:hypothetical protein